MQAIIETGGKQYRVVPGETLRVGKMPGDVGSEIELPVKAMFDENGQLVESAGPLKATIVKIGRAPKILVFKFKPKKQYKKTIGHRQDFTDVKIETMA
jgi:large subunit ribosomal protein L21